MKKEKKKILRFKNSLKKILKIEKRKKKIKILIRKIGIGTTRDLNLKFLISRCHHLWTIRDSTRYICSTATNSSFEVVEQNWFTTKSALLEQSKKIHSVK